VRRRGHVGSILVLSALLAACSLVDELLPGQPPGADVPDPPAADAPDPQPSHHQLEVDPMLAVVEVGEAIQLVATVRDAGGEPLDSVPVVWSSSDQAVATIDASGLATAIGVGGPIDVTVTIPGGSVASQIVIVPCAHVVCPELGVEADPGLGVESVGEWAGAAAELHRFSIPGTAPGPDGYVWGPGSWGNRYAPTRNLFPVTCADQAAVVWQAEDSGQVYCTTIVADAQASMSKPLVATEDVLFAATLGVSTVFRSRWNASRGARTGPSSCGSRRSASAPSKGFGARSISTRAARASTSQPCPPRRSPRAMPRSRSATDACRSCSRGTCSWAMTD
jgi:hypothetical protein